MSDPRLQTDSGRWLAVEFQAAVADFGLNPDDFESDMLTAWTAAHAGHLVDSSPESDAARWLIHCHYRVARLLGPDARAIQRWAQIPSQALGIEPTVLMRSLSGLRAVLDTLEPPALHASARRCGS